MRRNEEAALLAAIAGVLLLMSGWTGARPVHRFFTLLEDIFGTQPLLIVLAYVFVGLASLGGIAVLLGGYLIWAERVRTGRLLILVGSGAGFFTVLFFVLVNLRRQEFDLLLSVLPVVLGIALGIVSRFRAKAKPIFDRSQRRDRQGSRLATVRDVPADGPEHDESREGESRREFERD